MSYIDKMFVPSYLKPNQILASTKSSVVGQTEALPEEISNQNPNLLSQKSDSH
jgi:hypothetical protein